MTAKNAYEASRVLSGSDITYRGEFEVVNDADVRALTDFANRQVRTNKKLRVFVTERKEQRRI